MVNTTLMAFTYSGDEGDRRGVQRGRSGDDCYDDELGKCVLDKVDGADALLEFGATGEPKEIKRRPCAGVYVINNREALPAPVPTGRSSKSSSASISSFFGGSSATPPPHTGKHRAARGGAFKAPGGGRGASGGGRGRGAGGRCGRAASSSSTPSMLGSQAASKRPMAASPAAAISEMGGKEDSEEDEQDGGPSKRAKSAAFEIGAEHAEEHAEEEAGSSKESGKKAPAGAVDFRGKSAEEKAEYRHEKYEDKKTVAAFGLEPKPPSLHTIDLTVPRMFVRRRRRRTCSVQDTFGLARTRSMATTAKSAFEPWSKR